MRLRVYRHYAEVGRSGRRILSAQSQSDGPAANASPTANDAEQHETNLQVWHRSMMPVVGFFSLIGVQDPPTLALAAPVAWLTLAVGFCWHAGDLRAFRAAWLKPNAALVCEDVRACLVGDGWGWRRRLCMGSLLAILWPEQAGLFIWSAATSWIAARPVYVPPTDADFAHPRLSHANGWAAYGLLTVLCLLFSGTSSSIAGQAGGKSQPSLADQR